MRFGLLFILVAFIHCTEPEFNNPSDFGTDSYLENQTILCLTGQTAACRMAVPVCTTCKFFSTSVTYNGNRGGILGADAKCMNDSKKPPMPVGAVYKAFLVDEVNRIACTSTDCLTGGTSEHVDWVLKPNTAYVRTADNVTIATTNSLGIFTSQTNDAENPQVTNVFTGLFTNGWTTLSGGNCAGWTQGTTASARVALYSSSLHVSTNGDCANPSVIFCVEQ
ncbi:DUF1554 domain-containing protein [Leptospira kanakyensis]|uniref:DUF1554 domain-containing protein n=1 Tax=Leptospira kanakyensis TaxID=2484968 RepID=A0A6N4QAP2_9LEPT|nr:DUF1554 domain-containing protein [Leptospira kanakyensis]MCW7480246.1 DUF1554 domain-containing protein [Leptospira kanakyensis]TGK50446.1 DUF1554 domain-containing protein [Leptospira kanakyensis]TGK63952.1 DUF1554 domain-containing protein [Leptospira kanakyensis]TGK69584.1 DUF1554 domain-containing protein [Leptospira kanakyensis]